MQFWGFLTLYSPPQTHVAHLTHGAKQRDSGVTTPHRHTNKQTNKPKNQTSFCSAINSKHLALHLCEWLIDHAPSQQRNALLLLRHLDWECTLFYFKCVAAPALPGLLLFWKLAFQAGSFLLPGSFENLTHSIREDRLFILHSSRRANECSTVPFLSPSLPLSHSFSPSHGLNCGWTGSLGACSRPDR